MKKNKRKKAREAAIKQLGHSEAAQFMRNLGYAGCRDPIVLLLARQALATAPEKERFVYQKWVSMLEAGRLPRRKVYEIEPEMDEELERAVRDALNGWDSE